mgnify:CR=1 FL=1
MHHMLGQPATTLLSHVGFVAFYAFVHHGVPLLMLYRAHTISPRPSRTQPAVL